MTVTYMWSSDVKVKLAIKIVITKAEEFQTSSQTNSAVRVLQNQTCFQSSAIVEK